MKKIIRDSHIFENDLKDKDLFIVDCGFEKCNPQYSFGPNKRNYFLIHFVVEGKGIYEFNNKTFEVNKNQCFVIFPGDFTRYIADKENPWFYYWVGFNGINAKTLLNECNINKNNPIIKPEKFDLMKKYIISLFHISKANEFNQYIMIGYLYLFFSCINRNKIKSRREQYVKDAINYITNNFMYDIKIENLAKKLFIERSYLYKLFMEFVNVSPQEYIMQFRLNNACELLKYSNHNITDIANYVGFVNTSSFCKAFKKKYNMTPLKYRNFK